MALRRTISTDGLLAPLVLALALLSCGGSSAFKRGLEYEKLKNYEAALQSYEEALSADPDNARYRLYFDRARFQAAMAHFDRGGASGKRVAWRKPCRSSAGPCRSIPPSRRPTRKPRRWLR